VKKLHAEPSGYLGPIIAGLLGVAFIGAWGFVDYGATLAVPRAELRQLGRMASTDLQRPVARPW
jgi:hypothetical protein